MACPAAVREGVALVPRQAGAHGHVGAGPALSVGAAHTSSVLGAGVLTLVVVAGLVLVAVPSFGTLPLNTTPQGVADVAPGAGAHGAVVALLVVPGGASGLPAASLQMPTGVWLAQVGWGEGATHFVRVARVGLRATTDSAVVVHPTERIHPARLSGGDLRAGVDAFQFVAGFVVRAVRVRSALRVASVFRVAQIELRAGAFGLAIDRLADCISAAGTGVAGVVAGVGALVVVAFKAVRAVNVGEALRLAASVQRFSDVVRGARTYGAAILGGANRATGTRVF